MRDNLPIVKLLLQKGADKTIPDKYGKILIHLANSPEIISLLK
jgi:hypothetical protein